MILLCAGWPAIDADRRIEESRNAAAHWLVRKAEPAVGLAHPYGQNCAARGLGCERRAEVADDRALARLPGRSAALGEGQEGVAEEIEWNANLESSWEPGMPS